MSRRSKRSPLAAAGSTATAGLLLLCWVCAAPVEGFVAAVGGGAVASRASVGCSTRSACSSAFTSVPSGRHYLPSIPRVEHSSISSRRQAASRRSPQHLRLWATTVAPTWRGHDAEAGRRRQAEYLQLLRRRWEMARGDSSCGSSGGRSLSASLACRSGSGREETDASMGDWDAVYTEVGGGSRDVKEKRAGLRMLFRPAGAVLRLVREFVARQGGYSTTGMKARIVAWRRSFSLAMVGLAAGAVLLMSTAGPASASGVVDQMEKTRLTDMPEFSYQIREELIDLMEMDPRERAIDLKDLTLYSEELDKLDMFGDEVAVDMAMKETMRLKQRRVHEDIINKGKGRGFLPALKSSVKAIGFGIVVSAVSFSVGWVLKSFLSMAAEEEVHLYGEEISVDATEKPQDELEGLMPEEWNDTDAPPPDSETGATTPGDTPGPSPLPPTMGPAATVSGGDFSTPGGGSDYPSAPESTGDDVDDDLLGM